jgi:lipoprotein-releasing system ATP-binding protein
MGMSRKRTLLSAEGIWKEYVTGKNLTLSVLRGVDFEVREGEIVVIVGPSGSGKSTLLHILGGLDRPSVGHVLVDGEEIFTLDEDKLASFRNRKLGFVFQFHHLLPEFTALENVCIPALIKGQTLKQAAERGERLLREVGLGDRMTHRPSELSGGEQQRVAVARALMNNPPLILADEPSGNLDEENGQHLHRLLVLLSEHHGVTFVIATHNPDLTKRATRVLKLTEGKLLPTRHV